MSISKDFHDTIDNILVGLINSIMTIQMSASLFVFTKTLIIIIKNKFFTAKVTPITVTQETVNEKDQLKI